MSQKKLTKTEIEHLAVKIMKEVNEVNQLYNNTLEASKKYQDDIQAIRDKHPLKDVKEKIILSLKVELGTKYNEDVSFNLDAFSNGKYYDKIKEIEEEEKEYKEKSLKEIYNIYRLPNCKWSRDSNKVFQDIVSEITISQIIISDIHLLVNSIKAKLI
jgi:hypothetical protein